MGQAQRIFISGNGLSGLLVKVKLIGTFRIILNQPVDAHRSYLYENWSRPSGVWKLLSIRSQQWQERKLSNRAGLPIFPAQPLARRQGHVRERGTKFAAWSSDCVRRTETTYIRLRSGPRTWSVHLLGGRTSARRDESTTRGLVQKLSALVVRPQTRPWSSVMHGA